MKSDGIGPQNNGTRSRFQTNVASDSSQMVKLLFGGASIRGTLKVFHLIEEDQLCFGVWWNQMEQDDIKCREPFKSAEYVKVLDSGKEAIRMKTHPFITLKRSMNDWARTALLCRQGKLGQANSWSLNFGVKLVCHLDSSSLPTNVIWDGVSVKRIPWSKHLVLSHLALYENRRVFYEPTIYFSLSWHFMKSVLTTRAYWKVILLNTPPG